MRLSGRIGWLHGLGAAPRVDRVDDLSAYGTFGVQIGREPAAKRSQGIQAGIHRNAIEYKGKLWRNVFARHLSGQMEAAVTER